MPELAAGAFRLANAFVLPFWALLIFAPGWSGTRRVISGTWYLVVLAAYYAATLAVGLGSPGGPDLGALANPTLPSVHDLLRHPAVTAPAWTHFLVFDLCVARWIFLRDRRPGYRLSPVFLLTFLLGPLGLLTYLLLYPQPAEGAFPPAATNEHPPTP